MNNKMQYLILVILAMLVIANSRENYITEKPAFFKTCRRADAQFSNCFIQNLKGMFREWKDGIPGIKGLGTLDPLQVKRVTLTQTENPLARLNVDLLNAKLYGFSKLDVPEFSLDFKTLTAKLKIIAPSFVTQADYKIKGRVLNLDLDGSGKTEIKIDNIVLNIIMNLRPMDHDGLTFIDVKKLRLNIENVSGFHIENTFDGPRELQDSTNALINQNWRDFLPILTPAIAEAAEAVFANRISKVFGYLPANYLIEDFPSATEFSG